MNFWTWLTRIDWSDANLQWVLMGSALLGVSSSVLGCFAFLRGRSLMGDAVAHAALPGVCLAFMLTGSKNLGAFLLGAGIAGLIAAWCISTITRHSRIKEDTALGLVLSVFFGIGIVLLTQIQRSATGNQSGLDKFLFGQAASMVLSDVRTLAFVAVVLCVLTAALYKEFKVLCFDGAFGRGLGLPIPLLDGVLMTMIVAAVVVGLQAVGVVLMAAMLITPPAAARFWTEKLHWMVILSAIFGGFSGAAGTLLSTLAPKMPTGPLIVLTATAVFIFSLLFAPGRGVVARFWRVVSTQRSVRRENLLRDLYEVAAAQGSEGGAWQGAALAELMEKRHTSEHATRSTLGQLTRMGWVKTTADKRWTLTPAGMQQAYEVVRRHRLWEMFLMYETTFGVPRVHRDADAVEHFLPPEVIGQLEELLRHHDLEPRLKPPAVMTS